MRSTSCRLVLSVLAVLLAANSAFAQVQLRQEKLVIPPYRVGEPEKNPIFYTGRSYQGAKGAIYPYPLIDKLSDEKIDRSYNAIWLENPYVRYCILPEIGGRIFEGKDKTNNFDFIYRQHVIKPALIGMVGAWISGGVEWNIPHHHRASTFMTVDHLTQEDADGSKTVWVGEIELRHRMKWLVGMTLYPDKSYLKLTVKLINRTPLPHSMLYFANIATHANDDYQVIFPPSTEFGTQHGKSEFVNWPIGRGFYGGRDRTGIDLSWWKNIPTPASIFAWNYEDDFFGGYDHGKQGGIAVIADHHTAPGKKFFEWGKGPDGTMWDRILTDSDGPYLELMAGGYSDNQPDYSWIQPGETRTVEQWFYPIRQLGGIKNANIEAAVNLDVNDGKARVAFNTTSKRENAMAVLRAGDKAVSEEQIAISPDKPYVKEVALPLGTKAEDLKAMLVGAGGDELVSYQPRKPKNSPMPPRVVPPGDPKDIKTNEELYLAGLRLEQFHSPALEPYPYYEEALKRDPGDYRCNVALGILYLKRAMYRQAEERLNAAIARATKNYTNPKDTEACYYLGLALRAQGRFDDAVNAFEKAAWGPAWAAQANLVLAQLACRRGDFSTARKFVEQAMRGGDLRAMNLASAIARRLGNSQPQVWFNAVRNSDPMDYWARNEEYLALKSTGKSAEADKALNDLSALMHGQTSAHVELAADYANCGMWAEAADVLNRIVVSAVDVRRVSPMVYYFLGYCWSGRDDPRRATAYYRLAADAPPEYCFPFQREMIHILNDAMKLNPADAKAPYYLGNLLYDLQPEVATAMWERSRQIDDKFATVHRNLALAYSRNQRDLPKAIASLEKAVECDAKDAKLFAELDSLYELANTDPAKRLAMLQKNHQTVSRRDDALRREISLLTLAGNCDRAIELLDTHHFRLWEGESGTHDLHMDAHLLRARQHLKARRFDAALKDCQLAMEYPDRFETAKPSGIGGRMVQAFYVMGLTYEAMGRSDEARDCFKKAAGANTFGRGDAGDSRYDQALAQRKLGQESRAAASFDALIRMGADRLKAAEGMDFFAKFGTRQSPMFQQSQAHYLIGLGQQGKGKTAEAKAEFEAALKINAAHLGAKTMLAEM